jgi:hypothetical protein
MTNRIVCRIGGVDYGSAGQNLLMSLDSVSPMGPGGVGTATIGLRKAGGGITITNQQVVELYEQEIGTNKIPKSYLMGIVNRRRTGVMRGTNIKVWAIDTVDVNDALDGIVGDAKVGIAVASGTFTAQIASIYTQAVSAGTPVVSLDYASGILDPTGGATLPAVTFNGRTLRQMIQDRCNALQVINTALRMKFHIGPDTNPNRTTFGGPILYTYDAAASAPFIAQWFTDQTPAGAGKTSIAQAVEFGRIVEGAKLIQKRQVLVKATGGIYTGSSDPAVITTYKYPYSGDGARWGELVEDSQSLTDADGQAAIARAVRSTGTPRETIQLSAYAYALPGQYAKLDWALEGLAGAIYVIAAVSVDFRNWRNPLTTFTLGARRLMLGENPDLDELVAPVERDRIPPAKPANWRAQPASTYSATTRMSTVSFAFDGPQETDLQQVEVIVTINGVTQPMIVLARGILTMVVLMAPSASWTAFATARDTSGNKSDATATLSGTAAAMVAEVPGPPATVTLAGLRTGIDTWQANVSWTAGTGGTGTAATYEVRYYKTASGASTATILPVPTDNRVMLINGLALGVGYTINVRSVTAYGDRGGWSTGSTLTFSGETPGAPTISSVGNAKGAITFSIGKPTTGTGNSNIDRYTVGMAWYNGATQLGKEDRLFLYTGDPQSVAWMGVEQGATYKFTVTALTRFDDVGTASAQQTYSVPALVNSQPPNPDFEDVDYNNPTLARSWALTTTGGTTTYARDTSTFRSGAASAKIVGTGAAGSSAYLLSDPFVLQGAQTTLVYYSVKSDDTTHVAGAWPTLVYYDSSNAIVGNDSGVVYHTVGTGWEDTYGTMVSGSIPATTVYARLRLNVNNLPLTKAVWFDNVFVMAQTQTQNYKDASITKAKFDTTLAPIQKGTSNPAGMASGDTVFRSDKGRIGYYDGTRVLSVAPVPLPWLPNSILNPFSATGADTWYSILPQDMALYLERWTCLVRGNTTNNASNYWTIALQGFTLAGAATIIDSFNTSGLTVNALTLQDRALTTALTAAQYPYLAIIATKTAAPGTLLLIPHLRAREILT